MPFSGQQAGGGVQPDPACTGDIRFAPGVQVGEIGHRAARTVERFFVGSELDQVARHKPRGNAQMAQDLYQQPGAVATRARAVAQCLFTTLHPRFHANQIRHGVLHALVDLHQKVIDVDRLRMFATPLREPLHQARPGRFDFQKRCQLGFQTRWIAERKMLGPVFDKEIKWVDDRHVGHQIDRHRQFAGRLGEGNAGNEIAVGVLLRIDEMRSRLNVE